MPRRNAYIGRAGQAGDQQVGDARYFSSAPSSTTWARANAARLSSASYPSLLTGVGGWATTSGANDSEASPPSSFVGSRVVGGDLYLGTNSGGVYKKTGVSGALTLQIARTSLPGAPAGISYYLGEANGYHFCTYWDGTNGTLWRSPQNNPAGTWTSQGSTTSTGAYRDLKNVYWCAFSSLFVLVGQNGIWTSATAASGSWAQRYSGFGIEEIYDLGGGVLYAITQPNDVSWIKSTDGGVTWTTARQPTNNYTFPYVFGGLADAKGHVYVPATGKFWRCVVDAGSVARVQSIASPEGASSAWADEFTVSGVNLGGSVALASAVLTPSGHLLFALSRCVVWRKANGRFGSTGLLSASLDTSQTTNLNAPQAAYLTTSNLLWVGATVNGGRWRVYMDLEHEFATPTLSDLGLLQAYVRART